MYPNHPILNQLKEYAEWVFQWNDRCRAVEIEKQIIAQKKIHIEELSEFHNGIQAGDLVEILDGCCDVFVTGIELHRLTGESEYLDQVSNTIDEALNYYSLEIIEHALGEVLASNDTKYLHISSYPTEIERSIQSAWIEKNRSNHTGSVNAYFIEHDGDYWIHFRDDNNKIMKPQGFVPVDLTKFIKG